MKEKLCIEGCTPLSLEKQQEINGGSFISALLAGLLVACAEEVISDWDNFKRGLKGEPEIPSGG